MILEYLAGPLVAIGVIAFFAFMMRLVWWSEQEPTKSKRSKKKRRPGFYRKGMGPRARSTKFK